MPINAVNLTGNVYPAGPKGDTGPANTLEIGTVEKGEEASVTIVGESPNQILNFVLPIGPKGNTGEKGDQGPKGEQGIQGKTGPANSLTIGTVEKGAVPSATITGNSPNQVLNLVLPTGKTEEIEAIKEEQTIQNENIEKNAEDIATIKEKISDIDTVLDSINGEVI